jgi:Na+/glutamate symporter
MNDILLGLPLPAVVGLLIEALKKVGIIVNGNQARVANIVLSALGAMAIALMAEFELAVPDLVIVVVAAIYSVLASALGYELAHKEK